jgi:hypothetical protein
MHIALIPLSIYLKHAILNKSPLPHRQRRSARSEAGFWLFLHIAIDLDGARRACLLIVGARLLQTV